MVGDIASARDESSKDFLKLFTEDPLRIEYGFAAKLSQTLSGTVVM
jgi:hypothetical protein